MLIRQKEPAFPAISDTFELTETIQGLLDAIKQETDPGLTLQIARKALDAAEHAAWRIREQSRRIAVLERDSVTDPLTGVLNRRGFETELRLALADGARHGEHGAVLFLDLDGFKRINDSLGHSAGDAVLRKVAGVLRAGTRESDRVGRLGGDEFAVLMTRTTVENARGRAKSIEWMINNSAIDWQGQPIAIRASIGTDYFGPNDEQSAIMVRADQAMYRQKRDRRKHPRPTTPIENAAIPIPAMIPVNR